MKSYDLVEHIGGDMRAVYYVNGQRVSNHEYSTISNKGHRVGGRVCSMWTKCKPLDGGKLRCTNGKTVIID